MIKNLLTKFIKTKKTADLDGFELYNVYSSQSEAYIARGVLETNGIKCIIEGDILSSVYPSQLSFSGLRLYVRRVDFLMADQLLGNEETALS